MTSEKPSVRKAAKKAQKEDVKAETLLQQVEKWLSEDSFDQTLVSSLDRAMKGQGSHNISHEMLLQTIWGCYDDMPSNLAEALPKPDQKFIDDACAEEGLARQRHDAWAIDSLPELVQVVFLKLAASVDLFRKLGGGAVAC